VTDKDTYGTVRRSHVKDSLIQQKEEEEEELMRKEKSRNKERLFTPDKSEMEFLDHFKEETRLEPKDNMSYVSQNNKFKSKKKLGGGGKS